MPQVKATLYLLTGKLLGRMSQYRTALALLKRAAALNPNSVAAQCWIGWVCQQLNDYPAAVPFFERALQLTPSCAYAHAQMASSYAHLNRYSEAADELLRAFRMNPKYSKRRDYLLALGTAYFHVQLMNECVAAYEKASRLFPKDAEVSYWYGWALSTAKQFPEAEPVAEQLP
jgi:tetratricopeptide (TPR) repeat protein